MKETQKLITNDGSLDYVTRIASLDEFFMECAIAKIPFQELSFVGKEGLVSVKLFKAYKDRTALFFRQERCENGKEKIILSKASDNCPAEDKGLLIENLKIYDSVGFKGFVSRRAAEKFIRGFIYDALTCDSVLRQNEK